MFIVDFTENINYNYQKELKKGFLSKNNKNILFFIGGKN